MSDYKVRLAAPAARVYDEMYSLAAGGKDVQTGKALLSLLDKAIDETLRSNPLAGTKLCTPLHGIYWLTEGNFQLFYEVCHSSMLITLVSIVNGPLRKNHTQQVEVLCTEYLLTGTFGGSAIRVVPNRIRAN